MSRDKTDWKRPVICIVLLQAVMGVLAFLKGYLDPYMASVIPITIISTLVILITLVLNSNLLYAITNIILLLVGVLLQTILGNDRHLVVTCASFVVACLALLFLNLAKKWKFRILMIVGVVINIILYLILVLFGVEVNGSTAWIRLGSLSLQLTEIALYVCIFLLACIFSSEMRDTRKLIMASFLLLLNSVGMIVVSEIGSLVVLICTFASLIFLFIEDRKMVTVIFVLVVFCIVLAGMGAYLLTKSYDNGTQNALTSLAAGLFKKIVHRFQIIANPELDPYGIAYQSNLARKTMIMAGLFGSQYSFSIPVAESDYAYIALVARLGHLGGFTVIGLILLNLFQSTNIWIGNVERKEQILVAGLSLAMVLRSLLVIAGSCNLIPLMGIPCMFISAGGTSMMFSWITVLYTIWVGRKE